jgi:hypothetical protein
MCGIIYQNELFFRKEILFNFLIKMLLILRWYFIFFIYFEVRILGTKLDLKYIFEISLSNWWK